jgi:AcrR family transcriptional regulator
VDAIITATARILVSEGYDRASTNRIAAAAGISVGSLYQYFPSKEALVAALIDLHSQRLMDCFREAMAQAVGSPRAQATREIIRALVRAHRVEPRLHRVLTEQIPRVARLERIGDLNREAAALLRARLVLQREKIGPRNIDLAVFLLTRSVEAVTRAFIQENPESFSEDELVEGLTRMVLGYLAP